MLLAWIPLRQRPGPGTVSNAIAVGLVVNGALDVLHSPGTVAWRAVWLAAGIGLNGLATACYIGAGLGPGPRDGLMTGIAARGHSLRAVRTVIELSVLVLGAALAGRWVPARSHTRCPSARSRTCCCPGSASKSRTGRSQQTMTELIFGVGVPASAAVGHDPVAMSQEAERLAYDFVSAADHPCGSDPSFDTPTMLTWIAARTSRIQVASRVLAAPFRRPAMVAKFAASLDQLSGGRLILGLGGGYSDEEIAAVGAPELSPAGKIDALAEALQVIRGAWTQSGYSQHGRYHSVRDLEMEPKPAHPIPVWLARAAGLRGANGSALCPLFPVGSRSFRTWCWSVLTPVAADRRGYRPRPGCSVTADWLRRSHLRCGAAWPC